MSHKEVEKNVLDVYRKVSPSITNLDNDDDVSIFLKRRLSILKSLRLPSFIFNNRKLIDIGGGTGEKSLIYAMLGADVTILEPNEKSCEYAKQLFARFLPDNELTIINKSLFDFDVSQLKDFDIVVCEGVLHHTYDSKKAMNNILRFMKDDSIALIAISETNSSFKRDLQRKLIKKLDDGTEEKIIELSKKYFQEHLDRAVIFGLRPENTVIYDSYVLKQWVPVQLKEICDTFKENNFSYLSSFPTLDFFYQTKSWSDNTHDPFDYDYYLSYYELLEKIWMTSGEENSKNYMEHFDLAQIKKRVEIDYIKLKDLEQKIEDMTFNNDDLGIIQHGYLGIGINYFVGIKQSDQLPLI